MKENQEIRESFDNGDMLNTEIEIAILKRVEQKRLKGETVILSDIQAEVLEEFYARLSKADKKRAKAFIDDNKEIRKMKELIEQMGESNKFKDQQQGE